jgi:hypothetical protein
MKHFTIIALLHYRCIPRCRRLFSTTTPRDVKYGFIGLGKMGGPMASNLRTKLPEGDMLYVYDINEAATKEFRQKFSTGVEVAANVEEVVEHSVSFLKLICY